MKSAAVLTRTMAAFFNSEVFLDLAKLGLSALLAAIIGWERQLHGRPAGIRTHMLMAVGVTLFTRVSFESGDGGRIAAQVVTGIGFLGAGTIMRMGMEIRGLTTAASLWATSAIAMAIGAGGGFLYVGIISTGLALLTLTVVDNFENRFVHSPRQRTLNVQVDDRASVHDILSDLTKAEIRVLGIRVMQGDSNVELSMQVEGARERILEKICLVPGVKSARLDE